MNDCDCEECGIPATRTVRGIFLCDGCEPGGQEDDETPSWSHEVPSGLLNSDEDDAVDAYAE